MKDTVKIGVIQIKVEGDMLDPTLKSKNVDHALELLDKMAEEKPDLVVMPDEWYSGQSYGPMSMVDFREQGGFDRLCESAKKNGFYLASSVMDPPDPPQGFKSHMTGFLIGPNGEIVGTGLGMHAAKEGRPWVVPGEATSVVETDLGTLGILVGHDIFYPELARRMALKGAEILINPICFIDCVDGFQDTDFGMDHYSMKNAWQTCALARAYENQVFLAACCPVGTFPRADMFEFFGSSFVAGPAGMKQQIGDQEEMFTCEITKAELLTTRKLIDILENRSESLNTIEE